MIEGVKVKQLVMIPDERGRLMEILRCDEELFEKFGQVYMTTAYPGVVKGWHFHHRQTDHFCCVSGMMKLVLYDNRKTSTTHGQVKEFFLGEASPILVKIPPLVLHGFKGIGIKEAIVINCPTEPYDHTSPDEHRLPHDDPSVPYNWGRKDG